MRIRPQFFSLRSRKRRGVALVITLAFVVMVTVVIVAYFTRAITETQVSTGSASQTKVDLFTQGAVDTIVGDLQQEIAAGSVGVTPSPSPQSGVIYKPTVPLTMVPWRTGLAAQSNPNCVNLVKESIFQNGAAVPFYPASATINGTNAYGASTNYPPSARASNIPSDKAVSFNGRSISLERWNKPLLMPITTSTDYTPSAASGTTPYVYTAPDWILVTRSGSNPIITSTNQAIGGNLQWSGTGSSTVVGRYAYNVYDEGGLLDMNVAGYPVSPSTTSTNQFAQLKPGLSYADLTQVGLTQQQVDAVVGWRNYASMQLSSGSFPNYNNDTFPSAYGTNYYNYVVSNNNGFLGVSGTLDTGNGSQSSPGQTDRAFATRQQLIAFLLDTTSTNNQSSYLSTLNALQYLGTFSRDLNQPSYIRLQSTNSNKTLDYNASVPKLLAVTAGGNSYGKGGSNNLGGLNMDDQINPSFPGVRVLKGFTRNDGTQAIVGEPLVKGRFALNRLAWVTYNGPSADVIAASGTSDANIQALIRYGIPLSYLEQGTDANIQKYFGLTWVASLPSPDVGSGWEYNVHNGPTGTGTSGPIMLTGSGAAGPGLAGLAAPREPDFFELLKATVNVGSLGKSLLTSNQGMAEDSGALSQIDQPYNYNFYPENSVDFQVIQIGANIISQFQPANYPPRIVFDDGSGNLYNPRTIVGVVNLPYFYNVLAGVLQIQAPAPLPRIATQGTTGPGNPPTFTGPAGSGVAGYEGYVSSTGTDNLTASGIGALMEIPVIWNPHDPLSPTTNAVGVTPTSFRVVADSATPDEVLSGNTGDYSAFMVYGASYSNASTSTFEYSYNAAAASPPALSPGPTGNAWWLGAQGHKFVTATGPSAEIDFNSTVTGSNTLFPQPAMLLRPGSIHDLNGNTVNVTVPATALMGQDSAVSGFYKNYGGLPNYFNGTLSSAASANDGAGAENSNPLNLMPGEAEPDSAQQPYIGFYMGAFPLAWKYTASGATLPVSVGAVGCYLGLYTGSPAPSTVPSLGACYMTYRMQYKDVNGNWITYDTKYGKLTNSTIELGIGYPSLLCGEGWESTTPAPTQIDKWGMGGYWATVTDPRTSRFGIFWAATNTENSEDGYLAGALTGSEFEEVNKDWPGSGEQHNPGWLDVANGILSMTVRQDPDSGLRIAAKTADAGWPYNTTFNKSANDDGQKEGWMAWVSTNTFTYPGITPGLLSQNNTDVFSDARRWYGTSQGNYNSTGNYFADPDGMVRRGMGAFVPTATLTPFSPGNDPGASTWMASSDTAVGLPMARVFGWNPLNNGNLVPTQPDPTINPYTPSTTLMSGTSQAASRPYFLHRPFCSVAELGYVFSDTPWRNLDFSTAESGNAALLDVFCINDDTSDANGLVAGKVNLNTRQAPVLQAVLAGAYLDSAQTAPLPNVTFTGSTSSLNAAVARAVANALIARTSDTNNILNGTGPLENVSELVGKWVTNEAIIQLPVGNYPDQLYSATANSGSTVGGSQIGGTTLSSANSFYDGKISYAGFSGGVWNNVSNGNLASNSLGPAVNSVENFSTGAPKSTGTAEDIYSAYMDSGAFTSGTADNGSQQMAGYIQGFREAPVRALASVGQTRVWNLLIDVIAQTGRYTQSAKTPANFLVEGEQRYWVHVAIDRYTGQVLDKQIEVVKE